jgi:CheY-like chemotaxis protein
LTRADGIRYKIAPWLLFATLPRGDAPRMTLLARPTRLPKTPWGHLPPRLKVLFIRGRRRTGGWLAEALATDSATESVLVEREGLPAGLAELRDEAYDAILISQEADNLNALELLDAIRAGSHADQPIVVLGEEEESDMAALCYEAGADAYVCLRTATTRGLIWQLARAVERHELLADNRRLIQARRAQLEREHNEARRLLEQQLAMLGDLPAARSVEPGVPPAHLPPPLVDHYRELLRTYVMMGSGHLSREMQQFSQRLSSARVLPRDVLTLHVAVAEELIAGLGSRSARHVLNRANLLILEVLAHLAESYGRQSPSWGIGTTGA